MSKGELLYKGNVVIKNPVALFSRYNVSEKDVIRYTRMIENGEDQEAIDEFTEKYMVSLSEKYTFEMMRYLRIVESGELPRKDLNTIIASVALLSAAMLPIYKRNFRVFVQEALAVPIFRKYNITSPEVKRIILDNTLQQFMTLTESSMSQTQANVLNHIRQMQKELIIMNQQIRKEVFLTGKLDSEVALFKNNLQEMMPGYYKAMEDGNILKDRFGRNVKLDYYAEISTRTTLLNVERTSVETITKLDRQRVVEYYKRDYRSVSSPRQICISILSSKVEGKSLLALDPEAAKVLGIYSIEDAKAQGAMGIHCRHSIRPVSNTFAKRLEKKYFRGE